MGYLNQVSINRKKDKKVAVVEDDRIELEIILLFLFYIKV